MSLTKRLKTEVLEPLAGHGWGKLLARHGLDIRVAIDRLDDELGKVLAVDRGVPGFEEFSLEGVRAVEPGNPGLSVLYHALASPCCTADELTAYPSFAQLDLLENYIYGIARRTLADFKDPVIAVFAYQYRDQRRSTHGKHADLAFSRTGLARVGNHEPYYDGRSRGYLPRPCDREKGFRALPARYATFIAERRVRGEDGAVLRPCKVDGDLVFLFPVHKLFPGDECLYRRNEEGQVLSVPIGGMEYVEIHRNEKLARVHDEQGGENDGFVPRHPRVDFDHTAYPFVRDSRHDEDLVRLVPVGASCQVVPVAGPLIKSPTQRVGDRDEVARFVVPEARQVRDRRNRYWSTFELPARDFSRPAPEYLNIRQEVRPRESALYDLNQLSAPEFTTKVLEQGGYEAAHFIDNTCDGVLTIAAIAGVDLPIHPAFSLVTATDYFPRVDQVEVEEWVERQQNVPTGLANVALYFPQGGPQPMSDGRFIWETTSPRDVEISYQLPNCSLPHPVMQDRSAFGLEDPSSYTVTAVVGQRAHAPGLTQTQRPTRTLSWLPDAAADVYAPGWDVSQHQRDGRNMMVSYGLGSPFPEDAKLCAALNSFWPAVAPDSSRMYGFRPPRPGRARRQLFTSIPLTDRELGYHSDHPRVKANEVATDFGWDGDHGPYLMTDTDRLFVSASNPLRSDLSRTTLDGKVHFAGLDEVDTDEFISRIHALSWCRENVEEWCRRKFDAVFSHRDSGWWLVAFEVVPEWEGWASTVLPRLDDELKGRGYAFVFCRVGEGEEIGSPPLRLRFPVIDRFEIRLSNTDGFSFTSTTPPDPVVVVRKNDEEAEKL